MLLPKLIAKPAHKARRVHTDQPRVGFCAQTQTLQPLMEQMAIVHLLFLTNQTVNLPATLDIKDPENAVVTMVHLLTCLFVLNASPDSTKIKTTNHFHCARNVLLVGLHHHPPSHVSTVLLENFKSTQHRSLTNVNFVQRGHRLT